MRAAKLIVNPSAGRGAGARLLPEIRRALAAHGIDAECAATRMRGDALALAQRARQDGFELVIAAGGDGTVNEVANGLVRAAGEGVAGTLAIVPIGSGNDFVKMLDVPLDWREACARAGSGRSRRIDVGRVGDRIFVNNVGIGFDAQVGIEAENVKFLSGFARYAAALARNMLLSYHTPQVSITLDGECWTQAITLLTVGNGRCSGGGFWLTPNARIDDGRFDVCIARELSKPQILALVPHVMKGTHVDKPPIRMAQASHVEVSSADPLPVHADGEILHTSAHHIAADLLPGKLEVIG